MTLRWFAQRKDGSRLGKALTCQLYARSESGQDGGFIAERICVVESKDQHSATLCAGMLCKEQDARLRSFGCGTITEPGCEWHTGYELGRKVAHVEHNRAKASTLKKQVRSAKRLLNPRPWFRGT